MAYKNSFIVTLLGLIVLGILITASEGVRRKGKFVTPGGSHCKWVEKNKRNGSDVSYTLMCRCQSKGGGTMRYRCHYKTSFHSSGNQRQLSDSFLQTMKGIITIDVKIDILNLVISCNACTHMQAISMAAVWIRSWLMGIQRQQWWPKEKQQQVTASSSYSNSWEPLIKTTVWITEWDTKSYCTPSDYIILLSLCYYSVKSWLIHSDSMDLVQLN